MWRSRRQCPMMDPVRRLFASVDCPRLLRMGLTPCYCMTNVMERAADPEPVFP